MQIYQKISTKIILDLSNILTFQLEERWRSWFRNDCINGNRVADCNRTFPIIRMSNLKLNLHLKILELNIFASNHF